ncbi:uncharacterized protein LOC131024754 [Salvia miltiorrhiza]|uniref:uncharacterized protein LOC131024754 n=1 Tax=Salvia miltiorrhiza TaxID=226208 RepID=UPI0025AC2627|nr:uncharacterized protein LOC131024754 [Salvia miltiorrhiza]
MSKYNFIFSARVSFPNPIVTGAPTPQPFFCHLRRAQVCRLRPLPSPTHSAISAAPSPSSIRALRPGRRLEAPPRSAPRSAALRPLQDPRPSPIGAQVRRLEAPPRSAPRMTLKTSKNIQCLDESFVKKTLDEICKELQDQMSCFINIV